MVFRIVEGKTLQLGSVSGTDQTPIGLQESTRAQRVYLENPFLVPPFDQTVINSTASGSGVQVVGGGIVNVSTLGNTVTVSGPAFEELEGDDVDSLNTLTGTITLNGLGTNLQINDPFLNTISISGSTSPILNDVFLPALTPDSVLFINTAGAISEQSPDLQWKQSEGKNTLRINSDGVNPAISGTRGAGTNSPFLRLDSNLFNPWFSGSPATSQTIFEFDSNTISLMTFNTNSSIISTVDFVQEGGSGLRTVFNNISPPGSVIITTIPGSQNLNQLIVGGIGTTQRLHLQPSVSVGPGIALSDPTPPWTLFDVRGDVSISGSAFSIYVPDGSVSKPSFSFNEDQDSGIYKNTSDQICLIKDGLEQLCFDTSGVKIPNSLTVSGSPVLTSVDIGVASLNSVGEDIVIDGNNGNNVNTLGQTITIEGFRPEFITTSGFLQSGINANSAALNALDVVDSLNSLTGGLNLTAGANIVLSDNGTDTITISSVTDDDVDSINTVTGTVTLQGQNTVSVVTSSPNITISGSGIASLGPGPDGLVFIDDPTRSNKRLSVDRQVVLYSEDGNIDNTYLRAGNVVNNFAGWIIPRNATITAATYGYISGSATKNFILRINNNTNLKTSNVPVATPFLDTGLNIDVSAGDVLQIFIDGTGTAINDAFATIELAWRA